MERETLIINLYKIATLKITQRLSGREKKKRQMERNQRGMWHSLHSWPHCTQVSHTCRCKVTCWLTAFLCWRKELKKKKEAACTPDSFSASSLEFPSRGFPSSPQFHLEFWGLMKSSAEGSITDWGVIHFTSEAPKSYFRGVFECIFLTCEAFCKINMGISQFDKSTWNIT